LGAWLRALMLPLQLRVEDSGRCGKVAERPYALQGDEANAGAAMVMVMVMVMVIVMVMVMMMVMVMRVR
jgi:heme/copper-type cytochrome/quinol oxidase subunit 2